MALSPFLENITSETREKSEEYYLIHCVSCHVSCKTKGAKFNLVNLQQMERSSSKKHLNLGQWLTISFHVIKDLSLSKWKKRASLFQSLCTQLLPHRWTILLFHAGEWKFSMFVSPEGGPDLGKKKVWKLKMCFKLNKSQKSRSATEELSNDTKWHQVLRVS